MNSSEVSPVVSGSEGFRVVHHRSDRIEWTSHTISCACSIRARYDIVEAVRLTDGRLRVYH